MKRSRERINLKNVRGLNNNDDDKGDHTDNHLLFIKMDVTK